MPCRRGRTAYRIGLLIAATAGCFAAFLAVGVGDGGVRVAAGEEHEQELRETRRGDDAGGIRGGGEAGSASEGMLGLKGAAKLASIKRLLARSRQRLEADSENVEDASQRATDSERGLVRLIKREKARLTPPSESMAPPSEGRGSQATAAVGNAGVGEEDGSSGGVPPWRHRHYQHTQRQLLQPSSQSAIASRASGRESGAAAQLVEHVEALSERLEQQERVMRSEEMALAADKQEAAALVHHGRSRDPSSSPSSNARVPFPLNFAGPRARPHHSNRASFQLSATPYGPVMAPVVDPRAPASYASDETNDGAMQSGYVGSHMLAASGDLPVGKMSYIDSVFGRGRKGRHPRGE